MITTAVLIALALVAIPFVRAAFMDGTFVIRRSISIQRTESAVFDYLRHLRQGEHYNKWVMADPNARRSFEGTDGTVGFTYHWDSAVRSVGKGEQRITELVPNEKVASEIHFIKPFENVSETAFLMQPDANGGCDLIWTMQMPLSYPMRVLHSLINLGSALEKDMEQSLLNIKNNLERA